MSSFSNIFYNHPIIFYLLQLNLNIQDTYLKLFNPLVYKLLHMKIIGTYNIIFPLLFIIFYIKYQIAEFFSEFIVPSTSSRTINEFNFYLFYQEFIVLLVAIYYTHFNNFLPFLSDDAFIINNSNLFILANIHTIVDFPVPGGPQKTAGFK